MPNVFISYRREDAAGHAGRLYDGLRARFGEPRVFMDVDTVPAGVDFVDHIERWVASCDVLLVLIGDHWVSVRDSEGRRRLDNAEDFIRIEIEAALKRGVTVIPVLVEGAQMPRSEDLPESIAMLARRNAIELSDARWSYDVERLARAISQASRKTGIRGRLGRMGSRLTGAPRAIKAMGLLVLVFAAILVAAAAAGVFEGDSSDEPDSVAAEEVDQSHPETTAPQRNRTRAERRSKEESGSGSKRRAVRERKRKEKARNDDKPTTTAGSAGQKYSTFRNVAAGYTTVVPTGGSWTKARTTPEGLHTQVSGPGSLLLWIDYAQDQPVSFPDSECEDATLENPRLAQFENRKCGPSRSECREKPCVGYLLNESGTEGPGYAVFVGGTDEYKTMERILKRVVETFRPPDG